MGFGSWKIVPIAACVWGVCACGGSENGPAMESVNTPSSGGTSAGGASGGGASGGGVQQASPAGQGADTAGAKAAGAGGVSDAGASGSVALTPPAAPTAVAMINSFTAPKSTGTGSAGAAGGAAGAGANAGSGGGSSNASTAGAGGTGSGAGFAVVYGQASFTMVSSTEVFFQIEIMGGDNNQSYPVFLHEGTSCDSAMLQGAHWARGEGLPDIQCKGTTGVSSGKRDASDKRLQWTVGTMDESDVVGHLVVVHDSTNPIACGKIELKK